MDNIKKTVKILFSETGNVNIVAVTKTRSVSEIKEAVDAGIKIIGENRIQEAAEKYEELKVFFKKKDVEFHFVGKLQTNKVKKAVEMFDVIQTVDKVKIAEEIDKRAKELEKVQCIMIEVNIGKEKQKAGFMPEETAGAVAEIKKLASLSVIGLMCIPPHSENPEESRPYFKQMKKLFEKSNLSCLSMGMTDDYMIAIEEGSNMVRIGRGIFGERKY